MEQEQTYVAFEDTNEYPRGVYSETEYADAFSRLHPDFRPRCIGYETKEDASAAYREFTEKARRRYSR